MHWCNLGAETERVNLTTSWLTLQLGPQRCDEGGQTPSQTLVDLHRRGRHTEQQGEY